MANPARLAMNQATTREKWSLAQAIEGYARHGIRGISIWREGLVEIGLAESKRRLDDHGFTVTGLARGGYFPSSDPARRQATLDDNRRAIDQAAAVGARCLIIIAGGLPDGSRDLEGARRQIVEGLAELLPHARAAGVPLGIEPLHPMAAADRGCINTLAHANELCDTLGPGLGIVVDVYHVWWDPNLEAQIARARGRILAFHLSDWLVPTTDLAADRGMMGDGVIDLARLHEWVRAAGYDGFNEVEIFSALNWWKRDPDEVVRIARERYATCL